MRQNKKQGKPHIYYPRRPNLRLGFALSKRKEKKRKKWLMVLCAFLLCAALVCLAFFVLPWAGTENNAPIPQSAPVSLPVQDVPSMQVTPALPEETLSQWMENLEQSAYTAQPLPHEMRAMWFSFLEWKGMDFSSEDVFRTQIARAFEDCAALGLNTVIVSVRPFGDALYRSDIYPYSHVMLGEQGQNPGFDALAVMVSEAHACGLRLEAWVNPYRVSHPTNGPDTLSADNPALLNHTLVRNVNGERWYDPALPEVDELVVKGIAEIVQNYDVDGIHLDDYFYPEAATDEFDADSYAQFSMGAPRDEWRRGNVNRMLALCYEVVKKINPTLSFGISVQGNNSVNYTNLYADVNLWLANDGYTDYIMPQLYWGFGHVDAAGRTTAAFDNKTAEWQGYARSESVRLYAGLAAYRIGLLQEDGTRSEFGGNGAGDNAEWQSGHAMRDQVQYLRENTQFTGFALFRYNFLFQPNDEISAAEQAALREISV